MAVNSQRLSGVKQGDAVGHRCLDCCDPGRFASRLGSVLVLGPCPCCPACVPCFLR